MDKFKNRIKYFAIGLFIGVGFVYFVFGNRGCAWLPENRVKNMIGEKEIIVGDSLLDVMRCLAITNDDVYALLKSEGEVEFSKSVTSGDPKIYYIEKEKEEELYWARFALHKKKDLAEVLEVKKANGPTCSSDKSNEGKSTLPLPHADVIAILESNEFRILSLAECQMAFYGLTKDTVFNFHTTATIDIENSEPRLSPNPFYIMRGNMNEVRYSVKYIVGENRTRIHSIIGPEQADCEE